MTCRDCMHYEVCEYHEDLYIEIDITGEQEKTIYLSNVENKCDHFKNKADFVELPCMCKDCKHFKFINIGGLVGVCNLDDDSQRSVGLEDYCSYGERAESNDR